MGGLTETEAKAQGRQVRKGRVPVGRVGPGAVQCALGRDDQAAVRPEDERVIGGAIVGTNAAI